MSPWSYSPVDLPPLMTDLPTPLVLFAVIGLLTAPVGCSAQSAEAPGSARVLSTDPELGAMAERLLPDLAERSGMELRAPVRLEQRSRAELVRYLVGKLDEELPEEEARARADVYALLGLMEPDLDLRALLLDLYTEQVAGFYEPDSTALFLLDDQPAEALRPLLIHELVHAVQDQSVALDELTDPDLGNDRAAAAQAAIEGHATLVMFEYLTEQMTGGPVDLGEIPDFGAQVRPALEAMNSQFPALARTPRVLRESLLFPYVEGAAFVQGLWTDGTRDDPFGAALPLSTEQILDPSADDPVSVAVVVDDGRPVLSDVLGRLELGVLVEDVLGSPGQGDVVGAGTVAEGWEGDRYVLVEMADGSRRLVSVVLWDSASDRDDFADAAEASDGFGGPVTVERGRVDGFPATTLRVGGPVPVTVTVAGEG